MMFSSELDSHFLDFELLIKLFKALTISLDTSWAHGLVMNIFWRVRKTRCFVNYVCESNADINIRGF